MKESPDWAKDRLTSVVDVEFGWLDRFKILFGFKVELRVMTDCQTAPRKVLSETEILVYRPRSPRMFLGVAETEDSAQRG